VSFESPTFDKNEKDDEYIVEGFINLLSQDFG